MRKRKIAKIEGKLGRKTEVRKIKRIAKITAINLKK